MGMDIVELVYETEECFGIRIPDREAEKLVTVGLLRDFIVAELERQGRPEAAEVVYMKLRRIVVDRTGVQESEVVPDARFVEDLHLD